MDYDMKITEAIQLRDELKTNIESMMLIYSTATGLDLDVQASSGSGFSECTVQVNLPDKSALAKDVSVG